MIKLKEVFKNKYVRYFLSSCVGCILCIIFYPAKTIVKKIEVSNEKDKKIIESLRKRVDSFDKIDLEVDHKKRTIITEKKDGSKQTEIFEETVSTKSRIKKSIEKENRQRLQNEKEILRLKEYKKVVINKKFFNIGVGLDSSFVFNKEDFTIKNLYLRSSYDIFNSITFGTNAGYKKIMFDVTLKL